MQDKRAEDNWDDFQQVVEKDEGQVEGWGCTPFRGPTKAPLPRLAAKRQPIPASPLLEAEPAAPSASVMGTCGRFGQPKTPATTCTSPGHCDMCMMSDW